jgi:hypothetical protein
MPILLLVRVLLAGMMVAGMGSTALAAEDSTTGAVRQKIPPPVSQKPAIAPLQLSDERTVPKYVRH